MGRGEGVRATGNVNARRVAVRSIAWLDLFMWIVDRHGTGIPKLATAEETDKEAQPDAPQNHRNGLHLKVPDVVEAMRLK